MKNKTLIIIWVLLAVSFTAFAVTMTVLYALDAILAPAEIFAMVGLWVLTIVTMIPIFYIRAKTKPLQEVPK